MAALAPRKMMFTPLFSSIIGCPTGIYRAARWRSCWCEEWVAGATLTPHRESNIMLDISDWSGSFCTSMLPFWFCLLQNAFFCSTRRWRRRWRRWGERGYRDVGKIYGEFFPYFDYFAFLLARTFCDILFTSPPTNLCLYLALFGF